MDSNAPRKNNTRFLLAIALIAIGALWMLKQLGFYLDFPYVHFREIFFPIHHFFLAWSNFIFSWQVVLILVGLLLLAGRRPLGIVLIIIGGIFILPKLFIFPPLTVSFLLPALLVGLGIAMVVRYV